MAAWIQVTDFSFLICVLFLCALSANIKFLIVRPSSIRPKLQISLWPRGFHEEIQWSFTFVSLKADLPLLSRTLPLVIFGIFGILAGILALWLPETLYSPMAQTVEQAEEWDEDYKIYCCRRHIPAKEQKNIEMSVKENEANDCEHATVWITSPKKTWNSFVSTKNQQCFLYSVGFVLNKPLIKSL